MKPIGTSDKIKFGGYFNNNPYYVIVISVMVTILKVCGCFYLQICCKTTFVGCISTMHKEFKSLILVGGFIQSFEGNSKLKCLT